MEYYTEHTKPEGEPNESGSKFRTIIKRQKDENGNIYYKETGKVNVYDKIQEGKEATNIYNILDRYTNGDLSALNKRTLQYGDASNIPNNINDANDIAKNASNNLNALPDEIKNKILNGETVTVQDIENIVTPKTETTVKEEGTNE